MTNINRPRILYVDSSEDACLMLRILLGYSDIEVQTTVTISHALQLSKSEQYDLYLLDTWFPENDGFELCRLLREAKSQIPIVFYSGEAREIDKARGFEAGADEYLIKPNSDRIAPTIRQLIRFYESVRPDR